jgi:hypothetical protein
MSVTTTADEKIQLVKELLNKAHEELLKVLDKNTWGNSDLNSSYINELYDAVKLLNELNNKL